MRILSDVLRFDSGWYGWAQFAGNGPLFHASATLNLPDDYYRYWQSMASEDLLAQQFLADPNCVATYDRRVPFTQMACKRSVWWMPMQGQAKSACDPADKENSLNRSE